MLAHGGTPSWLAPLSYHRTGEGVATPLSSQFNRIWDIPQISDRMINFQFAITGYALDASHPHM